jgi:protoporphyrinogen oxidase
MKVVIIGAGPAGLVTCKTLLESATPDFPFDPIVLEQEDDIGGSLEASHFLPMGFHTYFEVSSRDIQIPLV